MAKSPPKLSIALEIDPPNFRVGGNPGPPTLYIAVTSHAPQPITVFTWPTILHPQLALQRKNFFCLDLTDDRKPLFLELVKVRRLGYEHVKGCDDDKYHITLPPEEPIVFESDFTPAMGTTGRGAMTPGHRYLFGVADGQTIDWWREGSRDEVLGSTEPNDIDQHPPIQIEHVQPIEIVAEQ